MSFDSFAAFLAMGGHGLYVWLAFGSTVLVMLANVVSVRVRTRRFFRDAADQLRRQQAASGSGGQSERRTGGNRAPELDQMADGSIDAS
ncbi:MAG: heme exporter protein CcmD [Pseudomonadales bacterium]